MTVETTTKGAAKIDREQIRHVAELAELSLSEEEEIRLTEEVGRIVAYVAELDAIDTNDVPPTAHVTAVSAKLRDDVPRQGLTHEQALAGAPEAAHDGFSVPTFIE